MLNVVSQEVTCSALAGWLSLVLVLGFIVHVWGVYVCVCVCVYVYGETQREDCKKLYLYCLLMYIFPPRFLLRILYSTGQDPWDCFVGSNAAVNHMYLDYASHLDEVLILLRCLAWLIMSQDIIKRVGNRWDIVSILGAL